MTVPHRALDRRRFLQGGLAASAMLLAAKPVWSNDSADKKPKICAFIKFVQSYDYDELAEKIAAAGFDGIEATVRKGGYIEGKDAEEKLPRLNEALRKNDLEITVLCTDIIRADQPHAQTLLRTAAGLGVKQYRMGFARYDLKRPILEQLEAFRPAFRELSELNREIGMQAVYQNHSGPDYLGGPLWDVQRIIADLPVEQMAVAYDIRHATIEGGLSWPLTYKMIRPHIGAAFVKDFDWVGRKAEHVPLGEGRVDPTFFKMLQEDGFEGPYSIHVEYLGGRSAEENLEAMKRDLAVLRRWLAA